MNDFLLHGIIPVTLYSKMLTFRDSNKNFKLDGDLLKTMTTCKFNVGLYNLQDGKSIREFAEEKKFDIKSMGRKSTSDSSIVGLPKLPAIIASGISTKFLSTDPVELCDKLRLLLQNKQAGNNSNIFNEEIVAKLDKFLEYKSITPSVHEKVSKSLIYCTQ